MKQPNTLTLSAVSRGFNWWNPPGNVTVDCNEAANADWPATGKLFLIDYIDNTHPIDLYMAYSVLANAAAGGAARFTCQPMLYPANIMNDGSSFAPPPLSWCHTFTSPAALGGSFTVDSFIINASHVNKKLTTGNWETVVGGTVTIVDVGNGNTYVCNITGFSAGGGAGGVSRFTCALISGPLSTVVTEKSVLFDSATTNSKIVLAAVGPSSNWNPVNYFD